MSQRTVTTPSTPEVVIENRRFNQALDAIFDDEKGITGDAFFELLNEGMVTSDGPVFTIHLDKLGEKVKLTITKTLGIPGDKDKVQIAEESGASFQSFWWALDIYNGEKESKERAADTNWIFYEPSDDITKQPAAHVQFFVKSKPLVEKLVSDSYLEQVKAEDLWCEQEASSEQESFLDSKFGLKRNTTNDDYQEAIKRDSPDTLYRTADASISLYEEEVKYLTGRVEAKKPQTEESLKLAKTLKERLEKIEENKAKLNALQASFNLNKDRQLAGTTPGAKYSSYGASLLDRVKYEGVVGKTLVTGIAELLKDAFTDAQKKIDLAELLEELSNVSDYNHVRVQIREKQYDEPLYKRLKESLEALGKKLLGKDEDEDADEYEDVPLFFQFNTRSNCVSPLMKSLQSIRVQKSINEVFLKAAREEVEDNAELSLSDAVAETKAEAAAPPWLPFAAVASVKAETADIERYKLDKPPVVRPPAVAVRGWLEKSTSTPENHNKRLMKFMFDGADARFDSRNKIKLDPATYLKTLVSADGNRYIVKGEDLVDIDKLIKDGRVEITTCDPPSETFEDGTPIPPVMIMRYSPSETERYSCTEAFDVNGNLHVELTSPVTRANEKPEAAALEFAYRLQQQVLFSAPEGYSDADRLIYLATFPIKITEVPEDITFKMMREQLEKVGFGHDYISYQRPDYRLSANLDTSSVDTPSPSPLSR